MLWIWTGFIALIIGLLALDLFVFHRKAHVVSVKEALRWSAVWVALGLLFSIFVFFAYENHWMGIGTTIDTVGGAANDGKSALVKYLTGYVIEKSLSVDNIFVIALLFSYFAVPAIYQHRVLFWGIIGALAMRGAMIGMGAVLIARFHWVLYLFGAFLIFTAIKMLMMSDGHSDPAKNPIVRLARRLMPVTEPRQDEKFLVKLGSRWALTPLSLSLIAVETTDLVFAVDSIPAIFAITADPFLVFTSNIFAILGLRSLYFALAGMMSKFRYLKAALAVVLAVVGIKMLAADYFKSLLGQHFNFYLLGVIGLIIGTGVLASLLIKRDVRAAAHAG